MTPKKPDTAAILATLKDFQRDTVEYAFERLWLAEDQTKRFLVADEVGLGKTMVAKGVIAKTVEHLWETVDRIDVVYICSNSQIARQNLARLNVVGGVELKHADRLTLLPKVIGDMRSEKVNFVSFTPGTSFNVGNSGGAAPERVLLYWMLAECWGEEFTNTVRWEKFFEGGVRRDRFRNQLKNFDRKSLDLELCASFGEAVDTAKGPAGGSLRDELNECAEKYTRLRKAAKGELSARRFRLIGVLRRLVAHAAVEHLEPDLVILDEFQRFKDVLEGEGDGAELARAVFDHPDAKVLLLSATPFKMYTLPDEPEGDDHFKDFDRTVRFLADEERADAVARDLRTMREDLIAGRDRAEAEAARDRVQHELSRVMCRTERLASTPDRDGMLKDHELAGVELTVPDVSSWITFDSVARHIESQDVFEYWRSMPYPLNLMEHNSYQVRSKFQAAVDREDAGLAKALGNADALLDWKDIQAYRKVDPGNAKLRGLMQDVLGRGAWQLAWLPPALPYYELAGAYANPDLRTFTKRLIFSAWTAVPKSIAVMVSYEAERLAMEKSGLSDRGYDARPLAAPLQFRDSGTTFSLLYPSPSLAAAGDPLSIARGRGAEFPMNYIAYVDEVRLRVRHLLEKLPAEARAGGRPDLRWYWAAPLMLDHVDEGTKTSEALALIREDESDSDDGALGRISMHLEVAESVLRDSADGEGSGPLGPRPDDLEEVLTELAVSGPAVCALRALARVTGGRAAYAEPHIRGAAFSVSQGLRSLFNKPEIIAMLRGADEGQEESYWRAVLAHCAEGGLQAVLDEYAHTLVESEGLQGADPVERAATLAEVMSEALAMRSATNAIEDIRVEGGRVVLADPRRVSSHFAARYGHAQSSDAGTMRETSVRVAFNSPFRPFVLASTSVGQEGLDFHTYSHAIVHWNLPSNPVDLEQREGRVHRYKGHAVRKNMATRHGGAALTGTNDDPWSDMFNAALAERVDDQSDISPFWVYPQPEGASIERYVPALPTSRESQHYQRLLKTLVTYRMLLGQPRQAELIKSLGENADWMSIDLAPPARS